MKVIYCGCKSIMKTQRTFFPRGKPIEVTDEISNEILKIDGFYTSMTADAKKELKFNENREKREIKKLEEGVQIVEVEVKIDSSEVKVLTDSLSEVSDQLSESTAENDALSNQLGIAEAQIEELKKQLLVEQAKNVVKAK